MSLAWIGIVAICLMASAALPGPWDVLFPLGAIIGLGVPHGALDGELARPALRPRFGRAWFLVFSAPYLALAALVLVAWRVAPEATLAGFLAVSAWHFGTEDAGPGRPWEAALRGGLPIAAPVLLHPGATAWVFGTASSLPFTAPPAWLVAASVAWAALAMAGAAFALRRPGVLAEMAGLVAAFAVLPPLTAFALYFVAFHAPRHMAGLVADPVLAPRVRSMRQAWLRSVPVTTLTLLLGASLWQLYPGPAPERLLAVTLQGLAALTLPHLLLSGWIASGASAAPGWQGG